MAGIGLDGRFELLTHLPAALAIFLVRLYQRFVSPFLGGRCRFSPSCSHYAVEALSRHGFCKGVVLTVFRVARCGPWHPGGYDPVPDKSFLLLEKLTAWRESRKVRSKPRRNTD